MMSIPLGPLALPAAPLVVLVSTLAAAQIARRLTRPGSPAPGASAPPSHAGSVLVDALLIALVAARLVHMGLHLEAYRAEPWAALDLRDGGWHVASGIAAGLCWIGWQARRRAAWRKGLAAGTLAGLALWAAGHAGLAALLPREMPDLALSDLATGRPVRLRDAAAHRPVVLNLWASWCGPCRREMPALAAAQERHPDVAFVFVNQGESAEAVRRYLEAERLGLSNVLLDAGSRMGPALGSRGLPTTVTFDRNGQRIDAHLGALNGAALSAMLEAVR